MCVVPTIAAAVGHAEIVDRVGSEGDRPVSLDLTIVAARPRLGPRLDEMRAVIAGLLGLDAARVNVKASTGNLEGWEGGGRGISASAVAIVESDR